MKNTPVRYLPLALLGLLIFGFAGCADTRVTTVWTAPEVSSIQFKKIFILGLNPDDANRRMAEVAVRDLITKVPVVCSFELLPEATHWFEQDGEIVCSTIYEHSILWSRTMILNAEDRVPTLQDFMSETEPEP